MLRAALVVCLASTALATGGDPAAGRLAYRKACVSCHGWAGDGQGPGAEGLDPPPRDFVGGVYAYRSTPTGSLPAPEDLERTVRDGVPGTAMPAWRDHLTPREIRDVTAWIRTYSPRYLDEEPEPKLPIPAPQPFDEASVAQGRATYELLRCAQCHGERGQGDGWATNDELRDDKGNVVHARDFTTGIYRSGSRREDLFRVFVTGLDGTPMPSYAGSVPDADFMHLVNYLLSLERGRGMWHWMSNPPRWYEPSNHEVAR